MEAVLEELYWGNCTGRTLLGKLYWGICTGGTVLKRNCSGITVVGELMLTSPAVMMKYWGNCQNMDRVFSGVTWPGIRVGRRGG